MSKTSIRNEKWQLDVGNCHLNIITIILYYSIILNSRGDWGLFFVSLFEMMNAIILVALDKICLIHVYVQCISFFNFYLHATFTKHVV